MGVVQERWLAMVRAAERAVTVLGEKSRKNDNTYIKNHYTVCRKIFALSYFCLFGPWFQWVTLRLGVFQCLKLSLLTQLCPRDVQMGETVFKCKRTKITRADNNHVYKNQSQKKRDELDIIKYHKNVKMIINYYIWNNM